MFPRVQVAASVHAGRLEQGGQWRRMRRFVYKGNVRDDGAQAQAAAAPVPDGRRAWLAFALGFLAIVLASRAAVASSAFRARPSIVGLAIVSDLTLTAAAVAWVTLVRTRRLSPASLVGVVSAGLGVAAAILPAGQGALAIRVARGAVPLAEVLVLLWVGRAALRLRRTVRAGGGALPLEDLVREAARRSVGRHRGIDALVTELSFVGMALCSWRSAPHVPPRAVPFTVHRTSGAGAVLAALALASVAEAAGAHLLLAHWSPGAAWIATGLSAYALVWLVGDLRALALRPVLLEDGLLRVRIGLRWRADVPLASIRAICAGPDPLRHRSCAVASPLGGPNLYLHLDGPAVLEGPLGLRRRGESLGLRLDDPAALRRAITARRPELR
jgi:hypothetical protein